MFYRPTSPWTWAALWITIAETITVLVIESIIFKDFQATISSADAIDAPYRAIPTFLALLIFGFMYQCLLLYDALASRNTIQLIGLCVYALSLAIYTIIQIDQTKQALVTIAESGGTASTSHASSTAGSTWTVIKPLVYLSACITALFWVIFSFIVFKLYDEFQWSIYQLVNGDWRMRQRFLTFQVYITLLKFDLFYFIGFILQFLTFYAGHYNAEWYLLIIAIPCTIATLSASSYFTRQETKIGVLITLILHFALLSYFVFLFVRMYQASKLSTYIVVRRILTYFGCWTILLEVTTIAMGIKCMANFHKGLKVHVRGYGAAKAQILEDQEMEVEVYSELMRRIQ